MVPNLDLFLIALLHGSLISCVLIIVIFIILIAILSTFSISLFSIIFIDAYEYYYLYVSQLVETTNAHLELCFVLMMVLSTYAYVVAERRWKPALQIKVSKMRKKLHVALDQADERKVR
ncbi:hypothetical protein HanIR_Chr01g0047761 [Helianthus annuus]|nr:hypothetical protein HanIR_Chr01g0047761 [Helianthus annuus]